MENDKWDSYFTLCKLGLKEKPAWIEELKKWHFSEEEIKEIIEHEDRQMESNKNWKEIERLMKEEARSKEQELIKAMLGEQPCWVKETKIIFFTEEIKKLEEQIKVIYEDNFLLRNEKVPLWFRQCLMKVKGLYRLEKDLRGAKMRLRIAKYGSNDNDITPEMIVEARKYPIDKIVKVKRKRIKCIWHKPDNNPSMFIYTKTNTAYCFSCGKFADAIDITMEKNNMNFIETIKYLNEK
jgi:DNA primase